MQRTAPSIRVLGGVVALATSEMAVAVVGRQRTSVDREGRGGAWRAGREDGDVALDRRHGRAHTRPDGGTSGCVP